MSGHGALPGWPAGSRDALGEVLSPLPAQAVCHVLLGRDGRAQGVVLQDGTEVKSKLVLSNASPQITFLELTPQVQGTGGWQGLGVVVSPGRAARLTAGLCPGFSHPRSSCQRILSSGSSRSTHAPPSPRSTVGSPPPPSLLEGHWCRAQQETAPHFPVAPPAPSGRGSAAKLPGCPQHPRWPAPAPSPVLHPSQLRGHPPPAPGLH